MPILFLEKKNKGTVWGMKKVIVSFFLLGIIWMNLFSYIGKDYVQANEYTVIPDKAIRLRILANSDSDADQSLKRTVRDRVNENINIWVADLTSLEEGRKVIKSHLGDIEKIVEETLEAEGSQQSYQVEFKNNVEFPTKLYGNFVYPAGEYEAVLITLGDGGGANWWCVLFPPLCFLDFSNGDAVQTAKAETTEEKKHTESYQEDSKQAVKKDANLETEKEESEQVTEPETESVEETKSEKVEVKFFIKEWMDSFIN